MKREGEPKKPAAPTAPMDADTMEDAINAPRPERLSQCTWGLCPGTHVPYEDPVTDPKTGETTHKEQLPDGSVFEFKTPKAPTWHTDDPELWALTKAETIHKERQKAFEIHWEGRTAEKVKEIEILKDSFRCFDLDDSGTLEKEEVLTILTRVGGGNPMTEADALEFIALFDQDGDGKMNCAEFIDAMKAMAGASGMNAREDAEEIAEMLVDDEGLKVLEHGKIKELEQHKNDEQGHGQTW